MLGYSLIICLMQQMPLGVKGVRGRAYKFTFDLIGVLIRGNITLG